MTAEPSYTSATVIGAGSWGMALAALLAERGLAVQLWGRDSGLMERLQQTRRNERYLPGLTLPDGVKATADLSSLRPTEVVVFVVPSAHLESVTQQVAATPAGRSTQVGISCAKGIHRESGQRMSQLIANALPAASVAVLTGPNHAEEVAQRLATAAVIACTNREIGAKLQQLFTMPWFRSYTTDDVTGAEWGGALKNPYAIAAGIAKALRLGDNAIAAMVTRALAEMVRFGTVMGGRTETFYGLSGVGDLVTTCFSEHSRNHRVGLALGGGEKLDSILERATMVAEGVPNTASLYAAARRHGVRTPLLDEVHAVLFEEKPPNLAMKDLLSRDPRPEAD